MGGDQREVAVAQDVEPESADAAGASDVIATKSRPKATMDTHGSTRISLDAYSHSAPALLAL
jgi:hypothetical protein